MASTKGFPVRQALPGNLDVVDINGDGLNGNFTAATINAGTISATTSITGVSGGPGLFPAGITVSGGVATMPDGSTIDSTQVNVKNDLQLLDASQPTTPAAGSKLFSAAGQAKYVSEDGSAYNTGCLSLFTTSPTTVNSTSAFTLLSCPVSAGSSYRFDGIVRGTQGPNAIGQFVRFAGPAASFGITYIRSNASANTSVTDSELGTGFPVDHTTPAWGAGVRFWVRFRGIYTFSAGGTFSLQARANSGVNTWTAEAGALMDVKPS